VVNRAIKKIIVINRALISEKQSITFYGRIKLISTHMLVSLFTTNTDNRV